MKEGWVVIKTLGDEPEAQIIKGLLESSGVPVFIKQEAYSKALGMPGLLSGIEILVPAKYAEEAKEAIEGL